VSVEIFIVRWFVQKYFAELALGGENVKLFFERSLTMFA